jgi:hypothetical protein
VLAFPPITPTPPYDPENDLTLVKIRRRRWPITIAVILAIIVIAGLVTYYVLYNQALEREANRSAAYELLDEAIALIQESDPEVISIDAAIKKSEVVAEDLPQRQVLIDRVPATLVTLDSAVDKATLAVGLLSSSDDKALAQHVMDAANNRQTMLNSGELLTKADIEAMNCAMLFGQAYDLIVTADSDMRANASLSGNGNYNDALEAVEANKAVLEKLAQAADLMIQAQDAFKEVDLSVINIYLELKATSVQIAIESDQALVDADIETALAKDQAFKDKDSEAVAAAANIPPEPLQLITSSYDKLTAEARQTYDSARANAADADVFIREYVGVETKTAVQ